MVKGKFIAHPALVGSTALRLTSHKSPPIVSFTHAKGIGTY